jgi:hypothetical protein
MHGKSSGCTQYAGVQHVDKGFRSHCPKKRTRNYLPQAGTVPIRNVRIVLSIIHRRSIPCGGRQDLCVHDGSDAPPASYDMAVKPTKPHTGWAEDKELAWPACTVRTCRPKPRPSNPMPLPSKPCHCQASSPCRPLLHFYPLPRALRLPTIGSSPFLLFLFTPFCWFPSSWTACGVHC